MSTKAIKPQKGRAFSKECTKRTSYRPILTFFVFLALISLAYGIVGNIDTFTSKTNPFNVTLSVTDNTSVRITIPLYSNIKNLSISYQILNNRTSILEDNLSDNSINTSHFKVRVLNPTGFITEANGFMNWNINGAISAGSRGNEILINNTQVNLSNTTFTLTFNSNGSFTANSPGAFSFKLCNETTGILLGNCTTEINVCTNSKRCDFNYTVVINNSNDGNQLKYCAVNLNESGIAQTENCVVSTMNTGYLVLGGGQANDGADQFQVNFFNLTIKKIAPSVNIMLYSNKTLESSTLSTANYKYNHSYNITRLNSILNNNCVCDNCSLSSSSCSIPLKFKASDSVILQINLTNATYEFGIDNCSNSFGINDNSTALNITFFNSAGTTTAVDYEITLDYGSDTSYGYNTSAHGTSSNFSMCKYPPNGNLTAQGIITYLNSSYSFDGLILTNTTQNIYIYTQNQDDTTDVLFTVYDTSTQVVKDAFIHILKWDAGTNAYTTTEIIKTDVLGQAVGKIVLNTQYYKFIIKYNGETKLVDPETQGIKLYLTTRTFTISTGASAWFDNYDTANDVSTTFGFNATGTNSFVFDFTADADTIQGCLRVDVTNKTGTFTLSDSCTTSTSASLVYAITGANCSTYTGKAYFKFDGDSFPVTDSPISSKFDCDFSFKNVKPGSKEPLFFAWMIIMALAFVGIASPPASLILACIGIIVSALLGLWVVAWPLVGAVIVLAFIIIYKGRK